MNELPEITNLKDINAYKKKVTWGDVPTIFHMTYGAVSELEGILTHGFDNAYKRLFNINHWNLEFLEKFSDAQGNIQVKQKPKITLKHSYNEHNYELHCFPIVKGERLTKSASKHPQCPFDNWIPESMQMLFRINHLVSFILYTFQTGDNADIALIRYTHFRVNKLIEKLNESFEIVDILGDSILEFCQQLEKRKQVNAQPDITNNVNDSLD